MYGKLFSSLFQGTLRGCADEILVFTNLIAHADSVGNVDKHYRAIAEETGISIDRVKAAIANLEAPDPESRSPEEEGKRLIPLDEHRAWGWNIVNYAKYRSIRNEEDRREQNRLAQERFRAKKRAEKDDHLVSIVSRVSQDKPKQKEKHKQKDKKEETREETSVEVSVGKSKIVEELFEFWQTVHGHPTARLTNERRKKISGRLKSGYTPEQIQEAILGCKASPFHQGQNDKNTIYDDIDLICRDDTKLEQFMGYKRQPNRSVNNGTIRQNNTKPTSIDRLRDTAEFIRNNFPTEAELAAGKQ